MSDPQGGNNPRGEEPRPVIIKGLPVAGQAERLVHARREVTKIEELTRAEQIEFEASKRGEEIVEQAKAKAKEIVSQAEKQAEEIRRDARQSGETSGRKEALSKLTSLITSLEKEVSHLRNVRSEFLRNNIVGIVEFACALAERILVAEMRVRPEIVGERACALIDRMPPGSALSLCVCPEDLETVERYLKDDGGPVSRTIPSLRSDPSIQSGSIRVESDAGLIDAGLLDALKDLGTILIEQARTQAGRFADSGGPDGA